MALGSFNAGDPLATVRAKFNAMVDAVRGVQTSALPPGGEAGQVLVKTSDRSFETAWTAPSSGGGGDGGPVGIGDVTGLSAVLAAKADASLLPAKADLVNGKVPAAQLPLGGGGGEITLPIAMTDVSGLTGALGGKADLVNGKVPSAQLPAGSGGVTLPIAISDVTDLQPSLDGKAAVTHTHAISAISGLQTALDGKAPASHTHTAAQISDATAAGRSLLTAAGAAAQRTALGLGTAATASTGTAAGNVVALDGAGKLPAVDGSQLTGLPSGGGAALPSGLIAMWSGAANAIPSGWVLCDGQSGTPNLRDRFVIGAGSSYGVGSVGGSASHTHTVGQTALSEAQMPSHTHAVSETAHQHTFQKFGTTFAAAAGQGSNVVSAASEGTSGTNFVRTNVSLASTGSGQAHGHTLTTDAALPPYYALCFIMKT